MCGSGSLRESKSQKIWEIFCQVIDNFGDIGVCWRLARALADQGEGIVQEVRLRVDDPSALAWMSPQGHPRVKILPFDAPPDPQLFTHPPIVIEGFGCNAPEAYLEAVRPQVLINLEYLSAEGYVERSHGLPSPIMHGAGKGLTRWFFYPGFTSKTGGLLRENSLFQRQEEFLHLRRSAWRESHGIQPDDCAISLFCYGQAPTSLLNKQQVNARLLVTAGCLGGTNTNKLPYLSQDEFDELLWACDINCVRGEDSLVRAIWANRPFLWNIYPQEGGAHRAKLEAFLDWLQAPASLRHWHLAWNGFATTQTPPTIDESMRQEWQTCVSNARARLLEQSDLLEQLQGFVREKT